MALFSESSLSDLYPFDKERTKKEILERFPLEIQNWKVINFPLELMPNSSPLPDLLGIRSIEINKEIKITTNPFSAYKRVEPSVYQIVAIIFITEDIPKEKYYFNDWCHHWRFIEASSYDMLIRKLNVEE